MASSLSKELVFLILQFFDEEKFKETVHSCYSRFVSACIVREDSPHDSNLSGDESFKKSCLTAVTPSPVQEQLQISQNNMNVDQKQRHDIPRNQVQKVICSVCGTKQDFIKYVRTAASVWVDTCAQLASFGMMTSGKCQILHRRQGHKEECRLFTVPDRSDDV